MAGSVDVDVVPVPFPGRAHAEELPGGGWAIRAGSSAVPAGRPVVTGTPFCHHRYEQALGRGRVLDWVCVRRPHPGDRWHMAAGVNPDTVLAVWPNQEAIP